MARLIIAGLVLVAAFVLLNTRLGIYLVHEAPNMLSGGAAQASHPLVARHLASTERIALPETITHVSGIFVNDHQAWLSTAQAELIDFIGTRENPFGAARWNINLRDGPRLFNRGAIESLTLHSLEPTAVSVAGNIGSLETWARRGATWRTLATTALPAHAEYTGVAAVRGEHWLTRRDSVQIYVVERDQWLEPSSDLLLPGRRLDELELSGIAFDPVNERIWLTAANYPSLLVLEPETLMVTAAYLIDAPAPSDVAVASESLYVSASHGALEAPPPIYRYHVPRPVNRRASHTN